MQGRRLTPTATLLACEYCHTLLACGSLKIFLRVIICHLIPDVVHRVNLFMPQHLEMICHTSTAIQQLFQRAHIVDVILRTIGNRIYTEEQYKAAANCLLNLPEYCGLRNYNPTGLAEGTTPPNGALVLSLRYTCTEGRLQKSSFSWRKESACF